MELWMLVSKSIHYRKRFKHDGLEIGFICGNSKAVKAMRRLKTTLDSGQFRAIQKAAYTGINHLEITKANSRTNIREDLIYWYIALCELGFKAKKPKGSFYCYVHAPIGTEKGEEFKTAGRVFGFSHSISLDFNSSVVMTQGTTFDLSNIWSRIQLKVKGSNWRNEKSDEKIKNWNSKTIGRKKSASQQQTIKSPLLCIKSHIGQSLGEIRWHIKNYRKEKRKTKIHMKFHKYHGLGKRLHRNWSKGNEHIFRTIDHQTYLPSKLWELRFLTEYCMGPEMEDNYFKTENIQSWRKRSRKEW